MAQSELDVYRNIVNTYKAAVKDDPRITALRKKLEEGGTKTESAWSYGNVAGEQMEKAFLDNAQAIVETEDGYNAVKKALKAGYDDVSEYSADVLSGVNQKAGIGMKGTPANFDDVRSTASAISNKISNAETVEECENYIREEVKTFTNNAAGDTIRETAKMADSQGMNPKIERTAAAHACQYCADLSGSYVYPCDRNVFSRHANCDCTIEYIPVKGAKKIVSSSTYRQNRASMSPEERERRAQVKGLGADISGKKTAGSHEPPIKIDKIDRSNPDQVKRVLDDFERRATDLDVEHALVIFENGDVYECFGVKDRVWPDEDFGFENLTGTIISHNHEKESTQYSFGNDDASMFRNSGIQEMYGFDYKYRYHFSKTDLETDNYPEDLFEPDIDQHMFMIFEAQEFGYGYTRELR